MLLCRGWREHIEGDYYSLEISSSICIITDSLQELATQLNNAVFQGNLEEVQKLVQQGRNCGKQG
jgi:hypothetical protein